MGRSTVYNHIVSKEKMDMVNPENIELGEDWLEYLQSIDRSPQSIVAYRNDLKIFWVWNLEFNKNKFFTKGENCSIIYPLIAQGDKPREKKTSEVERCDRRV